MKYIPLIKDVAPSEHDAKKECRGFYLTTTARLLCPRELGDKSDRDKEVFCNEVLKSKRMITDEDWLSFLCREGYYNPDASTRTYFAVSFLYW